jgi:hypothetical protein
VSEHVPSLRGTARQRFFARPGHAPVVEVGEGHAVLGADGVADDDLVDVVELVPVLLVLRHVPEQGLELGACR